MADGTQAYNLPSSMVPAMQAVMQGAQRPVQQVDPATVAAIHSAYGLQNLSPVGPMTAPQGANLQAQTWQPDLSELRQPVSNPTGMPTGGFPSQQQPTPEQTDPTLDQAWHAYAAGIKDHTPTRADFDKFSQYYQTRYVDPFLTGVKGAKPAWIKANQAEFQQRAQEYGDGLTFPAPPSATHNFMSAIGQGAKGEGKNMLGGLLGLAGGLAPGVENIGHNIVHPDAAALLQFLKGEGSKFNQSNPIGKALFAPRAILDALSAMAGSGPNEEGDQKNFPISSNLGGTGQAVSNEGQEQMAKAYGLSPTGAIIGQAGAAAAPVLGATLLTGGADLPVLGAAGLTGLGSAGANAATQTAAGQNPEDIRNQAIFDAVANTAMAALPTHTPGANVLRRMVRSGVTNTALGAGQELADKGINQANTLDWKNPTVQGIMGALLGAFGGNKAPREGNLLTRRGRTGPAPDQTAQTTPPTGEAPAAAPTAATDTAAATTQPVKLDQSGFYNQIINEGASAQGVSAEQHANALQNFTKELNIRGKTKPMQLAISRSKTPDDLVSQAAALARTYIPDESWNSFSVEQREMAVDNAAEYLTKKTGMDAQQVTDTLQKYKNPEQPAAPNATGEQPAAQPAQPAQPAQQSLQETPLPTELTNNQTPIPPTTEQLANASSNTVTGEHPEVEAQHIFNVVSGATQDPAFSGSPLGMAMHLLQTRGKINSAADVQSMLEKIAGKTGKTEQQPAVQQARNVLKVKTNAEQAAEHDNTASAVTEALAEPNTPAAAKNKLKARVRQNSEQKYNEQFMQAALNHGVSSGAAEDSLRADPHFMAVRQALESGQIKTPEQVGAFLANERSLAEQANKQVETPVTKPKGIKGKKAATTETPSPDVNKVDPKIIRTRENATRNVADNLLKEAMETKDAAKKEQALALHEKADKLGELADTAEQAQKSQKPKAKPLKGEAKTPPKPEAPVANTGAASSEFEQQLHDRFAETLSPKDIDQLHDAVANARMGDAHDLGDLLEGWQESGDLTKEDAKWLKQQAKIDATIKAPKSSRSLEQEYAEARANEEPNDDYLNDEYYQNNASGESSASLEAQNRLRSERSAGQTRAIIRRDGSVEPLHGVDAVDIHARTGEVVVQRGVGKDEWTVLSHGDDLSRDIAAGKINRARDDLRKLHTDIAPKRTVDVPGFGKVEIDQTHDVQLLGGSPNKGNKFYADRDWNPIAPVRKLDGTTADLDRSPYLGVHELEERRLEQQGEGYTEAHRAAQRKENDEVRKAGFDPESYQDSFTKDVAAAAKKVHGDMPDDIVEKPYEHPHSVRAREALKDVQDHAENFGPHGEYTLPAEELERLNDERTKSYVGTEKEPDRVAPIQTKRRVGKILENVRNGADIHETGRELQNLHDDLESQKMQQHLRDMVRTPKRGVEYVRQRLQEMVATNEPGSDHYEAGKFAQWLLEKNPNLANYLAVRIHDLGERGPAGRFSPAARMFHINSKDTNPTTAVHEIMHSAVQLMPDEFKNRIVGEYLGRLQNKIKQVQKNGNDVAQRYLELAAQNYVHPSIEASKEMSLLMRTQQDKIPYDEFYKYSNPDEYWAVESTDMLNNRYLKNGMADKIKDWLSGFFQHVKSLLGLDSNHQVSRALDAILKTPGEDYHAGMLNNRVHDLEARGELNDETKQTNEDEQDDTTETIPANRPTKSFQRAAAARAASAETRGYIGKVNYGFEQLANARIGIEKAMAGLRRSGIEITPENNVENAASLSQGKVTNIVNRDSYDFVQPVKQWVDKNFQRFASNKKEFLEKVDDFFSNTNWLERVRSSWLEEAPMKSPLDEIKRAQLLEDVEKLKIDPVKARAQLESMAPGLQYSWEQWGRNHDVPIKEIQKQLGELKSKYGMDQNSMSELNGLMDGTRERQTQRLQQSGMIAHNDPWVKFRGWKWYVPLKSSHSDNVNSDIFDAADSRINLARLNSQIKAMKGRSSFAERPFMRLFVDMSRAGKLSAEADIHNALYNLVAEPTSRRALGATVDTWEGTPHDGWTNAETGEHRSTLPVGKTDVLIPYGRTHYVVSLPEDSQLLRGLVQMNNIARPNAIERGVSKLTNTIARLDTTVSPVWQTATAFVRDLTYVPATLAPRIFDNPLEAVPFFAKYTVNAVQSMGALRYLVPYMRGNIRALDKLAADNPGSLADWMHRYYNLGGSNEYVNGFDIAGTEKMFGEGIDSLPKSADDVIDATKLGWNAVLKYTGRYADFLTQLPRIAAFRTLVEQGMHEAEAAAEARKVLDYSNSGVQGRRINSWLAFFRVGATGVDAMRRAFTKPTGEFDFVKLAKYQAFYSALGAMGYMASSLMLGQDDDGKDTIRKMLPETVATRVLFPLGGDKIGGWQIGLGLPQIMMAPGALMAAVQSGNMKMEDAIAAYYKTVVRNSAFEPGGVKGHTPADFIASLIKGFTPTVARPLLDIADNTNDFGYSIHGDARKDQYHADSGKPNTPDIFKEQAQWLNKLTNGAIDFYPEELEYLVKNYGGQWASTLLSGADRTQSLDVRGATVPGLVHDAEFYQQRQLYDTLDELNDSNRRYNAIVQHAKDQGSTDEQAKAQADQMLLANPELRQQRQLHAQLASAASARAAAMKQLRQNKFMSPQGRELQMKQIDSRLRQTLDNVTAKMQQ